MRFLHQIGSGIVAGWHAGRIFHRMIGGEISTREAEEFCRSPDGYFERRVPLPILPEYGFPEHLSRGALGDERFLVERRGGTDVAIIRLYEMPCPIGRMNVLDLFLQEAFFYPSDEADLCELRVRHWDRLPERAIFAVRFARQSLCGHWLVPYLKKRTIDFYRVDGGFPAGSLFAVEDLNP